MNYIALLANQNQPLCDLLQAERSRKQSVLAPVICTLLALFVRSFFGEVEKIINWTFYGLTCEGTALGHGAAIFFNLESGTFKLLVFVLKGGLLHDICLLCTGSYHLAAYTGGT